MRKAGSLGWTAFSCRVWSARHELVRYTEEKGLTELTGVRKIGERLYVARLRLGAGFSRMRRHALAPWRLAADVFARPPDKLLISPQDIRTADPVAADDIYAGFFAFGSHIVNTHGVSPFLTVSPSAEWEQALMGFGWLRHLRAADTPLAKANAQALVDEWIRLCGAPSAQTAWSAPVASRRLISWLSQSPMILENADLKFYRRFVRNVGRHITFLKREVASGLGGEQRLAAIIALNFGVLCAETPRNAMRNAQRLLISELDRQILPDGGHPSRSPQPLLDVLLDLLPLRQTFLARNETPPPELSGAIDRIMPMLRLFRHGDGALALFNGMGVTAQDLLMIALAYDDARAAPLKDAPASGFQRLEAGVSILIADAGAPPSVEFSARAHAGTLSFEFSSAGERLIVNCGAPAAQRGAPRQAARLTAAHSTLTLADTSSSRFAGNESADTLL
ncbi:MAG: hypothetical protein FJX29_15140, partial [Alphaproteobacteria bacterium]|nr:hypothetical protein [Alphaproteobacteria bacterium]